ncbi:SYF2 splicing factor-domain-containing protein [Umbelopsis sp. PMI_123]|nr:SYF2 splicing factor-domain-containing protein [Umbelopsis sp. PMI_123]
MPPKRKAAKASKNISVKEQDAAPTEKKARVDDNLEDATNINEVEETPAEPSTDNSDSYGDRSSSSAMAARFKKLQELKRRRATEVEEGNRRDRNLEFQRSKENPRLEKRSERKREEAEKLLEKQEAQDRGEDYERKQFWKYSAESVEAWEKKIAKKAKNAETGFADYTQAAHKKYKKLIAELKPDMAAYYEKKAEAFERALRNGEDLSEDSFFNRDANNLDYATIDTQPQKEAIDRLVADVDKQQRKRQARSRDREQAVDDISWINEKNRKFNQKIARFYDKYTKEIRENLERGTAL